MSLNVPPGNIVDLSDVHLKLHYTYSTLKIKTLVLLGTLEPYLTPNFGMGGIC